MDGILIEFCIDNSKLIEKTTSEGPQKELKRQPFDCMVHYRNRSWTDIITYNWMKPIMKVLENLAKLTSWFSSRTRRT